MTRQMIVAVAVAVLGSFAAGCEKPAVNEEPAPTSGATSGLQIGNPAPEGVQVGCTPTEAVPDETMPDAIPAGTYCVCDLGSHEGHLEYQGAHLALGQPVVIPNLDMVTNVKLGNNELSMLGSKDKSELLALLAYPHEDVLVHQSKNVPHFVRITRETGYTVPTNRPGCDPARHLIKISFCWQATDPVARGAWQCAEPGGHQGDTHAQD